ncbi:hypothetical protein RUM44_006953 [Polyplax serrata]|uniref:Protein C10 n=1 Tax=Polyplax serrata TaxID=468196 RepID=A0ABR1AZC3_POLSC
MTDPETFTPSKAKAVLTDILEAVNMPENAMKLEQAKGNAGNDMIKMMQYVFPIIVQIQMDVIKNYGFPEGREGMVHFSQLIRNLEREDSDVAELHSQLRTHLLPPVNMNTEASL